MQKSEEYNNNNKKTVTYTMPRKGINRNRNANKSVKACGVKMDLSKYHNRNARKLRRGRARG